MVDWPGLICILGAKPDPTLMGHALLPKSFHLSGSNLPYLCFGSSLDWPEDHYFARQWIPLLVSSFQSQKVLLKFMPKSDTLYLLLTFPSCALWNNTDKPPPSSHT